MWLLSHLSMRFLWGAAVTLAGVLAVCLVVSTSLLRSATQELTGSSQTLHLASQIENELLAYERLSNLAIASDSVDYYMARAYREQRLRHLLAEGRSHTRDADEIALLDRVQSRTDDYITQREAQEWATGDTDVTIAQTSPTLGLALDELDSLIAMKTQAMQRSYALAKRLNASADAFGIAALVMLAGVAGLGLWARRYVYRPLQDFALAINHFDPGGAAIAAPEHMPRELRRVARSFNLMATSLRQQHHNQLTFLAAVAHDIRTPLAALQGSLSVMHQRLGDESSVKKPLEVAERQVAHLDRMVGDLLETARIEAGELKLQKSITDLRQIARDAVALYDSASRLHNVRLWEPQNPVPVCADRGRIEQVVHNLLSNAIKYSPEGGPVDVVVTADAAEAHLACSDKGMGVSSEQLPHLFEPFHRGGQASQHIGGVGLGLSVARRIIEGHGGRIDVTSRLKEGAVFTIHLPRYQVETSSQAPLP